MRARSLDRPGLHIPRNPQTLRISAIPHLVQFADGDVIALAILHAGISEVTEQQQNPDRSRTELKISFALTGHRVTTAGGQSDRHLRLYASAPPESRLPEVTHFVLNDVVILSGAAFQAERRACPERSRRDLPLN